MKQYIVDAFTNKPFAGNPAAVCVMDGAGRRKRQLDMNWQWKIICLRLLLL